MTWETFRRPRRSNAKRERRPLIGDPAPFDWLRKEERVCCLAATDVEGRVPIGFCGPDCIGVAQRVMFLANR